MATRATTQRSVRTKKLSTKAHLQIYRENELEATIEDVGQGVAKEKVETGVEKAEESVSFLLPHSHHVMFHSMYF